MNQEQFLEIKSMFIDISGATSSAFEAISFGLRMGKDVTADLHRQASTIRRIAHAIGDKTGGDCGY